MFVFCAKRDPPLHIDAAQQERRVDAVVDVVFVDIGFERRAGPREKVRIARGVMAAAIDLHHDIL